MARPKKSSVVTGTDEGAEPQPVAAVVERKANPEWRKGLTETWFHQGVMVKFDRNGVGLNMININNPLHRHITLALSDCKGFIVVTSTQNANKKYFVSMSNVRYFIEEE